MLTRFKLFENYKQEKITEEVTLLKDILKSIVESVKSPEYINYIILYHISSHTFKITYDTFNDYFNFNIQINYDKVLIDVDNSCGGELRNKLNLLLKKFDIFSESHNAVGKWIFDRANFMSNMESFSDEFVENIDKYNL